MAISSTDAAAIHKLAQAAGIDDDTLAAWTEEEGGYRFAITSHTGAIKAPAASRLRERINKFARTKDAPTPNAAPEGTLMATDRQVTYILDLLAERERTGDGGGFMTGPTDQNGIEQMTRREASMYITSLTEDY
ncbi:hypothetical protein [Streptomyces uncialis]|uniref:Uncharacterized protein n=1 Tax=Streptomyces uncialis TaxID=1048205 RepID=A0A1Q4V141_9ACTN|nr:hypothetical protein [Streptomyces uncialis]OKH91516.1 hypothetical protein AB852_28590 [Streptomyces uncialis]